MATLLPARLAHTLWLRTVMASGPHPSGFNKLNLEADLPDAVFDELKLRGPEPFVDVDLELALLWEGSRAEPAATNRA